MKKFVMGSLSMLVVYAPFAVFSFTSNPEDSWGMLQGFTAAPGLLCIFFFQFLMRGTVPEPVKSLDPEYSNQLFMALSITAIFYAILGGVFSLVLTWIIQSIKKKHHA